MGWRAIRVDTARGAGAFVVRIGDLFIIDASCRLIQKNQRGRQDRTNLKRRAAPTAISVEQRFIEHIEVFDFNAVGSPIE